MKTLEQKSAMVLKSLEQDRQKLLLRQPFIGMVLMNLELVPTSGDCVKTACTDGARIMFSIPFYAKLNLEERLFVLAHEAWHCVLMHGLRCQTRNQRRFNIAADLEIHFILQKEKMKEPFVLPHKTEWDGLSAEEIYERLGHKPPRDYRNYVPRRESEHIRGKENGEGFDQHVYAGSATSLEDAESQPIWNQDAVERLRRFVIQAAQVMERAQGHLPAYLQGIVERLRKPQLSWRELLRQFVTSCYGGSRRWLPPSRRYLTRQLYLPSYRSDKLNAVLAIDTSGSTTDDLPQFFAELSSLLNSFGKYELTVIQCDREIQHVETFTDARRLPRNYEWVSHGHGGTCFKPPFEYVKAHNLKPAIFIYLTDGDGNAPEKAPKYPVLWVLTQDGQNRAKWGRAIRLKHG